MEHKEQLDNIRLWLMTGAITIDKAREMAKPHIDAMNLRCREIAKKHGVAPRLVNFASFMR